MPISCTPDNLADLAKCYTNPSQGQLLSEMVYLLCQIANAGGGGGVQSVTTAERLALTPTPGQQVYDTDFNTIMFWDGTAWRTSAGVSAIYGGGTVDSTTDWNVSDPTKLSYAGHFVFLSGSTLFASTNQANADGIIDLTSQAATLQAVNVFGGDNPSAIHVGAAGSLTIVSYGVSTGTSTTVDFSQCPAITTATIVGISELPFTPANNPALSSLTLSLSTVNPGLSDFTGFAPGLLVNFSSSCVFPPGCVLLGSAIDIYIFTATGPFPILPASMGTLIATGGWAGVSAIDMSASAVTVQLDIEDMAELVSFVPPTLTGCPTVIVASCALDEASVDALLFAADDSISGSFNTSAGTSAPPSVAGAARVLVLQGAGWTVTTN